MNAYELADELDRVLQVSGCDNRVPRMLRQQADEIQGLKDGFNTAWGGTNNSELAEVRAFANRKILEVKAQADKIAELEEAVDLLSANLVAAVGKNLTKELTDEEVREIATEHIHLTLGGERFGYLEFARAILRKAQEK